MALSDNSLESVGPEKSRKVLVEPNPIDPVYVLSGQNWLRVLEPGLKRIDTRISKAGLQRATLRSGFKVLPILVDSQNCPIWDASDPAKWAMKASPRLVDAIVKAERPGIVFGKVRN